MKNLLLPAFLLALLLTGCGRDRIVETYPNGKPKTIRTYGWFGGADSSNLQRERRFYFNEHLESDAHYRHGVLDGDYRDFWHNGQKESVGAYKNGKREGVWEIYYNQFTLSTKGLLHENLKEGQWNSYWENGALKSQGDFVHGKETGLWKEWDAKGEPVTENSCFESNDTGRYISYHANKTVKEDYTCKRGVPTGAYLRKDADGSLAERGSFDAQGRKDGAWETFNGDGKRASLRHYAAGLEHDSGFAWDSLGRLVERAHFDSGTGERLSFDGTGHLIERRHYLKGEPEGESWAYWPTMGPAPRKGADAGNAQVTGPKRSLLIYKDGKPTLVSKWYPNGKPMTQGQFLEGHRAGEWKDWWENGKPKEVYHFLDGALHGDRTFYDSTGKLLRTARYEHGYPAEGKLPKSVLNPTGPGLNEARTTALSKRVFIRLHNLCDTAALDSLTVHFPADSVRFASIAAKGYSPYIAVDSAYPYAAMQGKLHGRRVALVPTDFVGEKALAPGHYTWDLSVKQDGRTGFIQCKSNADGRADGWKK